MMKMLPYESTKQSKEVCLEEVNVFLCIHLGFMLRRHQYFLMALQQLKEVRCVAMLRAPNLTSLAILQREFSMDLRGWDLWEGVGFWATLI